jgi:hypothetical protein
MQPTRNLEVLCSNLRYITIVNPRFNPLSHLNRMQYFGDSNPLAPTFNYHQLNKKMNSDIFIKENVTKMSLYP